MTPEEVRAYSSYLYGVVYKIVVHPIFNCFIYLLIFGSSVTLALHSYDQSEEELKVIEGFDYFFTAVFIAEMILKLIGLGPKFYVKDPFNVFDAIIVMISVADIILFNTVFRDEKNEGFGINSLKALRLLRILRLARIWRAFQIMLN